MKRLLVLIAIMVIALPAYALHKDATGLVCDGCHVIHDGSNAKLLKAATTEALCLQCHDSTGTQYATYSATVPVIKNATGATIAGDYADLAAGDTLANSGTGNGHNNGSGASTVAIPGSTSADIVGFDCGSCHDAHGSGYADDTSDDTPAAGTIDYYRNLWQLPPDGDGTGADITCVKDVALANGGADDYDLSDTTYGDVGSSGSGFTAWCGSCHDDYLTYGGPNDDWTRHPNDEDFTENNGTEDMAALVNYTAGSTPTIPMQDGAASSSANAGPMGDEVDDEVFCLTCHNAHASANANAMRWDNTSANPLGSQEGCQACHAR